jgi:hypothetical protein
MAKEKVNLAGWGIDVLFGESQDRGATERPKSKQTPPPDNRARDDRSRPETQPASKRALHREIKAPLPSWADPLSNPTPVSHQSRVSKAEFAQAHAPSTAPSPMHTGAYTLSEQPPASVPPPREKPEATDPVVRAKMMGMRYQPQKADVAAAGDLEPGGPETPELVLDPISDYEKEQPSQPRAEEEVMHYVGLKQRQALWREISELYKAVPEVLCTDENLSRALQLLQEAQDILLEKPRQFDVARYKVSQVNSIVTRRIKTSRWANSYGWLIFFYQVSWLAVLLIAVFYAPYIVDWALGGEGTQTIDLTMSLVLWNTMTWGGLGGIVGGLYSLYWHVAKKKDFDKQYLMWYIVHPVIGLLVGGMVYLLLGAGLITAVGQARTPTETAVSVFPYAVACIAGFRQRFILEIVDRIIQVLTPQSAERREASEGTAVAK